MISCKAMTKFFLRKLEKRFPESKKKWLQETYFKHFFHANFFMFVLLISNHTVFLVQFEINLHLWVFQKGEIALSEAARTIYFTEVVVVISVVVLNCIWHAVKDVHYKNSCFYLSGVTAAQADILPFNWPKKSSRFCVMFMLLEVANFACMQDD